MPEMTTQTPVSLEKHYSSAGEMAILFDSSKCTACKGCQVACKCWNNLPSPLALNSGEFTGSLQNPPDLGPNVRTLVTFSEADNGKKYGINWAFGHRGCMHCTDAACVTVCPSGALRHNEFGFVDYDPNVCIGCQYCRSACPFDVPRHTGVGLVSGEVRINKCDACPDRIVHGMAPACVSTCQPNALQFGQREEMLAEAHRRVEFLKKKGFKDARVYGEEECSGTHMIQVLKYGIDQYELPEAPEPQLSGLMDFMKPLGAVAGIGAVAAVGITMATAAGYKRKNEAYDPETDDVFDLDTGEVTRHIDTEGGER